MDGAVVQGEGDDLPYIQSRRAMFILRGLVALKLIALFVLAWNRRFVMDEFVQFGWAKYIPDRVDRLAADQAKAEGYAFFFKLAHVIGWNARSMLLIGRMEMAFLATGTLVIVYALARSLGESKTRSTLIVLILLSFSDLIERIFETRGDPVSVFFAAAGLLVAIRGQDRQWWIFAAGVLSGLAFVSTQKAVYFNFALGVALVSEAALDRRFLKGIARGAWLALGWLIPIVVYCVALGGGDPLAVGHNLFFGPVGAVSPQIATEYGGLRGFVVQTLVRNALLYLFCFAGMVLALRCLLQLNVARRVALIFSVIITALVFVHNQPWPYVFIMALPFMALWAPWPVDALAGNPLHLRAAWAVLAIAIAASFVKNVTYLPIDNREQLALVDRAEQLLRPNEVYFDGTGMLPDRPEPSTLWLDRHAILQTLAEGRSSEAYRIFVHSPPKLILWNYRVDSILPVILPLIRDSYVQVAPNIRMPGARLRSDKAATFDVPIAGNYALYDFRGNSVRGQLEVNGVEAKLPLKLRRGEISVTIRSGPGEAFLVPQGSYTGRFAPGADNKELFAGVYD